MTIDKAGPPLPRLWPDTEFFWTSGADGQLRFLRCQNCGKISHPPVPFCRVCHHREFAVVPVSGKATVWSFSVVYQPFVPWVETPYVLGLIELAEDSDVHLTTRIVGCPVDEVYIGMPVHVLFEHHGDIYLPLFTPDDMADG